MATITGLSGEVFDEADVHPWEYLTPPEYWKVIDTVIVADRHLPDGTRQHMVQGYVPAGTVVDNAQIIGQADLAL